MSKRFNDYCPKMISSEASDLTRTERCDAACRSVVALYDSSKKMDENANPPEETNKENIDRVLLARSMKEYSEICYRACGNRNCGTAISAWEIYSKSEEGYRTITEKK